MRRPDRIETREWQGHEVTIRAWVDPTDLPWDGDEELDPEMEGWDLYAEAEIIVEGQRFEGRDSLGSCWGDSNYIRETLDEHVIPEALHDLEAELLAVSTGRDAHEAKQRQAVAKRVLKPASAERHPLG